jgi:hypothetical protein
MARLQIIAIIFSISLLVYILRTISQKKLKEEYSLLWLGVSIIFLLFSAWRQGLEKLAHLLGVAYAPAALFILMLLGILLILIQFSVIISKLSDRTKVLVQEMGIMKLEIEEYRKQLTELTTADDTATDTAESADQGEIF